MRRFILWLAFNVFALWVAVVLIPGVRSPHLSDVLWAGLLLGAVNSWVAPVLRFLTLPLRWLTLGLFSWVLNVVLFYFVAWVSQRLGLSLEVSGLLAAIEGALVVSLVLSLWQHMSK